MISTHNEYHHSLIISINDDNSIDNSSIINNQKENFLEPGHDDRLLRSLNCLRIKGHLLDVTLWVQNEPFQAHRVVLASISDYFRAMFTDPMKERFQADIILNGISSIGLQHVLDYIYTAKCDLTLGNIQDVLSAASHLQITHLVDACSNYLKRQLDIDNCVDIAYISENYSLRTLKRKVFCYMSENLKRLSKTSHFQRLQKPQLEHLLDAEFPVNVPEIQVLDAVLHWCRHNNADIYQFISKINIWDISHTDLEDRSIFLQSSWKGTLTPSSVLINSRGMKEAIVKVGGFTRQGLTNSLSFLIPQSQEGWHHLTKIPHIECCNFGVAVMNNELFVVGGCWSQFLDEHIHSFGFKYNPRHDEWNTIAPMNRERCRFTLTVIQDSLYAIGGISENLDNLISCEKYTPNENIWTSIASIPWVDPHHFSQHASVAWQDLLFISGGLEADVVLNSLYSYNTLTNSWECKADMLTCRVDHSMVVSQNTIYVIGGWYEDPVSRNRILVQTIDAYDIISDTWRIETVVPSPRFHSAVLLFKSSLLIIMGGFHSDSLLDSATGLIEVYDLVSRSWKTEKPYPLEIWEQSCVSLYIPRCRDDKEILPY